MKKILLYFNLSLMYILRNKLRFALTTFGIIIGLVIFLIGNVCIDTYVTGLYKEANCFSENSILIIDPNNSVVNRLVEKGYYDNLRKYSLTGAKYVVAKEYKYNDKLIEFGITLVGSDYNISSCALPYKLDEKTMISESGLLYGRDISFEDVQQKNNVIIIEKSTAKLLFMKENAVGEYVDIISPYGYDSFKVIGVIEDLPYLQQQNFVINSYLIDKEIEEIKYYFHAYIPYTFLETMAGKDVFFKPYVFDNAYDEIGINDMHLEVEWGDRDYSITSKSQLIEEAKSIEKDLKGLLVIIVVSIIIISCFLIMTMYIFSIKERTYEIGIRRAVGATRFDIIMQFVLEGVITAIFAFVITFFVSVIICNYATSYFVQELCIDTKIIIRPQILYATIGVAILEGILFSLMPAFVAARIRPTEAIRWD